MSEFNSITNTTREHIMSWWNNMSLEEQFYILIEYNDLIIGDHIRHPNTLTGSEIEKLFHKKHSLFQQKCFTKKCIWNAMSSCGNRNIGSECQSYQK